MATELEKQLASILRGIINDLPSSRDWLDPTLEKAAKNALAEFDRQAEQEQQRVPY